MSNVKKNLSIDMVLIDVLKKSSKRTNSLTCQSIANVINQEYDLKVDKKTVKRHLEKLSKLENQEYGNIKSIPLANGGKKGWYIEKSFSDSEILTIILSLYSAKNLNLNKTNQLIGKLCKLSNDNFIKDLGLDNKNSIVQFKTTENKNFYDIVEVIMLAIETKKAIRFDYFKYDINCKQKKLLDDNNKIKIYKVMPLKLIVYNGRFYLHCHYINNNNKVFELRNFRVDRIENISIIEESIVSDTTTLSAHDIIEYTSKHVFMYGDDPISCVLKINKEGISEFIDWFGNNFNNIKETNDSYIVKLNSCYSGMKVWALQHLDIASVKEPKKLRDDIKNELERSLNDY